ncbi:hypothetical protein FKP32DRAFT_611352 [Trametes sanguinea]|nr:hypothetical protein FKP32DRAFT_611352 [Trametes sanguinea]
MVRTPACRVCRERKVRCRREPGDERCQPCVEQGFECTFPGPDPSPPRGAPTQRIACDRCHRKHMRCEREGDGCVGCAQRGVVCSLQVAAAEAPDPLAPPPGPREAPQEDVQAQPVPQMAPENNDPGPSSSASHGALIIDTAPSVGSDSGPETVSTAPTSPGGRAWWDVCLSPSPQGSGS